MAIDLNKEQKEFKYYYSDNGVTQGPLPIIKLLDIIDAETLVYRDGIDWTNAKNVNELNKFFKVSPLDITSLSDSNQSIASSINIVEPRKMFTTPFSFEGRVRRFEYGISAIIYYIIYFIVLENISEIPARGLVMIPFIWFILAQGAKRCHDRGNSGWYQIIPFYIFWMLFAEGDKGVNDYGNSSK